MSTVLLLHSVQISASRCFSNYKTRRIHVTDGADWKHAECDISNAILYKLFFSGVSDHDSVKLCYSMSQVFSLFVLDVWLQRRSVITVGFMQHWSDLLLSCGPDGIQVFVKPAMKP